MAWPPPVLPINRTNATPQFDTHAADHNITNQALNDTVTQLAYITTYSQTVNGKADANATAIANQLHPANPAIPIVVGSGTATSTESSAASFGVPTTGLWIIGWGLTISAGSYGFIDAAIAKSGGTVKVPALIPFHYFEGTRQQPVGLVLAEFTQGDTVHLRVKTFAASVGIEGGQIVAQLLRTP